MGTCRSLPGALSWDTEGVAPARGEHRDAATQEGLLPSSLVLGGLPPSSPVPASASCTAGSRGGWEGASWDGVVPPGVA